MTAHAMRIGWVVVLAGATLVGAHTSAIATPARSAGLTRLGPTEHPGA
jgi:hypothetical protein